MIDRRNYLDVRAYLKYLSEIRLAQANTSRAVLSRLNHLIVWADDTPFPDFQKIKPTFQAYMEGCKKPDGSLFSAQYLGSVFKYVRAFLFWAKREWPARYKYIDPSAIEAIRASRARSESSVLQKRELYTLEDVRKITSLPGDTVSDRRSIAAVAFLFLSGMRIAAFLSLPIQAVNLSEWSVRQLPELGVKTKNSKAAITYLLNIPDLREIVAAWDQEVRSKLPPTCNWYPVLNTWGEITDKKREAENGRINYRKALKKICEKAGVPYLSAHKFRHGHAVYALKRSSNVEQLKAVSQNLMHSNMGITDGIYGRLVNNDVRDVIQDL